MISRIARLRSPVVVKLTRIRHPNSQNIAALSTKMVASASASASTATSDNNIMPTALATAAAAVLSASCLLLDYHSGTNIHTKRCAAEAKPTATHHPSPTPASVSSDDKFENVAREISDTNLPIYTSEQISQNNGKNGTPIWMSYGGIVYDVTEFIHNHPGGSERILLAAGGALEPFWHLYRQHFASDLPMRLMEDLVIGNLREEDQDKIDEDMEKLVDEEGDPYAHEPLRSERLIVHGDQPMNAEVPGSVLLENYLTPTDLFYIRHHHPVPFMVQKEINDFTLEIDLTSYAKDLGLEKGKEVIRMSMDDIKALPKVEVISTLQCSGNRRGDMNSFKRTSGTSWSQGAISTAKFSGARLNDVLKAAGVHDPVALTEKGGIQKHLQMESLDGMKASINMEKATNPYGDVIIAYEMNNAPLPRDHGFPLRCIVPGYAAVRNVKWLRKIQVSDSEAEGAWQQGLNYKTLPPNVTDAKKINLAKMPSMTEVAVFSGIATIDIGPDADADTKEKAKPKPGDIIMVKAKGWAWAGGGRNIVRVDVTGDQGTSWQSAEITKGGDQRFGRAWAWVFWECDVPAVVKKDGSVDLASKAVDLAFNSQPESAAHGWNVRGLGNNSWHRASVKS